MKDEAFDGPLFSEKSAAIEEILSRFEDAWESSDSPMIEEFLTLEGDQQHELLFELVHSDLEFRFNRNESPIIESYLKQFPKLLDNKESFLKLVVDEYRFRQKREPKLDIDEYRTRFPELSEKLSQNLEQLDAAQQDFVNLSIDSTFFSSKKRKTSRVIEVPEGFPQKVGRFEVSKFLGEGGFGTVLLAHDPQLEREIALKILRSEKLNTKDGIARFHREGRAAAQLRHPHIVAVFESGEDDGIYFIASEYVDGSTLQQVIGERKIFSSQEAAALISQLASALHYAHSRKIIHRDIKPENIMFDTNGEPAILDFGLARIADDDLLKTREGTGMGTLPYMSPEQARGKVELVNAKSDLWSLGVVFYEILTGNRPFDGEVDEIFVGIQQNEPKSLRSIHTDIPKDLESICLKCLEKKQEDRYASCEELAEDLQRWLRGEATQARPIKQTERFRRWCVRNPIIASLSTAVVITLITGASVSTYFAVDRNNALNVANENAERAKTSEKNAQENSLVAQQSVNEFYTDISENILLNVPGLQSLRDDLLRKSLDYYLSLININSKEAKLQKQLALAYLRVGKMQEKLNIDRSKRKIESMHAFDKAISLFQNLIEIDPMHNDLRYRLALCYAEKGSLLYNRGYYKEANSFLDTSLNEINAFGTVITNTPQMRLVIADIHGTLSQSSIAVGKVRKAENYIESSALDIEKLCSEGSLSDNFEYWVTYATVLGQAAEVFDRSKDFPRSEQYHLKKISIWKRLVKSNPNSLSLLYNLSKAHISFSIFITHSLKLYSESFSHFDAGIAIVQRLKGSNPDVREYLALLGYAHDQYAYSLHQNAKTKNLKSRSRESGLQKAIDNYEKALSNNLELVKIDPLTLRYQETVAQSYLGLGQVYRDLGKFPKSISMLIEAVKIQKALVSDYGESRATLNPLAGTYSTIASVHEKAKNFAGALENEQLSLTLRKKICEELSGTLSDLWYLSETNRSVGWIHNKQSNYEDSLLAYESAIRCMDKYISNSKNLGERMNDEKLRRLNMHIYAIRAARKCQNLKYASEKFDETRELLVRFTKSPLSRIQMKSRDYLLELYLDRSKYHESMQNYKAAIGDMKIVLTYSVKADMGKYRQELNRITIQATRSSDLLPLVAPRPKSLNLDKNQSKPKINAPSPTS